MNARCFQVSSEDNVATLLDDAPAGAIAVLGAGRSEPLQTRESIARGHKVALADIANGGAVLKYGARIGHATQPIPRGSWVHLHNLASDLDERSQRLDLHTGAANDHAAAYE